MNILISIFIGIFIGYTIKCVEIKDKYIMSTTELYELGESSFNAGYNFKN